jgi:hypothetical protein
LSIYYREENEETGEIPVAFVVRRSGISLSSSQVLDHVNKQVITYLLSFPIVIKMH